MPKVIPPAELDAVVFALKVNRGRMSVDALARQFPQLPRRTLQRHLAWLVADGQLRAEGRGPARRYHPPIPQPIAAQSVSAGGNLE